MRIAVAGSSGLIGSALVPALRESGHDVVRLVRREPLTDDEIGWQPEEFGVAPGSLDGVEAVVNLCGAGVGDHRWTGHYKQVLRDSRMVPTEVLVEQVRALGIPLLVSGSATGYYGDTGSRQVVESSPAGGGFLADLAKDWEQTALTAADDARVVLLRTAPVLSPSGGLLGKLRPLFTLGLGGRLGDGKQYFPWISLRDMVRAIDFLIATESVVGPVNMCGPRAVTNAEFTKAFGRVAHRPTPFVVPGPLMKLAGGELAEEMILGGQNVVPKVLTDHDFEFLDQDVEEALEYAREQS
ncbi:TIGR01777 family oxidoreductase [Williamsia sterculiae]|uniref:TIGR01777 family protein n=1 Tax=Williamsia sterculiae TaxID=1344003 RepID=A0A1N7GAM6_9NOCA|nr:TIGR01777 family oxidoreductase [Williamsia sterculiae]SIS09601.1 hypothetical protein SAMN05445060_2661 [Williamsia sterculiae]